MTLVSGFEHQWQQAAFAKCCTCLTAAVKDKPLLALTERPENGECSLAEMLYEVANIDTKLLGVHSFLDFICSACCSCLVGAYDFVRKARSAHASLLESQQMVQNVNGVDSKTIDCLVETPIEWPAALNGAIIDQTSAEILDIKVEGVEAEPSVSTEEEDNFKDDGNDDDFSEASDVKDDCDDEPVPQLKSTKNPDCRADTGANKFACKVCDRTFSSAIGLNRHARTHLAAPKYDCTTCGCSFRRKVKWQKHQRTRAHIRRELEASSQSSKGTKETSEVGAKIVESLPPTKATQQQTVGEEKPAGRRMGRPRKNDGLFEKDADGLYICTVCNQTFAWRRKLQRHMKKHFPQPRRKRESKRDLARSVARSLRPDATFQCLWCQRRFSRRSNYEVHALRHGIPSAQLSTAIAHVRATSGPNGMKRICCMVCGAVQVSVAALRQHLLDHAAAPESHGLQSWEAPQNYSIINALGFELSLEDSETEGEEEYAGGSRSCLGDGVRPALTQPKYDCALCSLRFQRKFEVILHQRSLHKHEKLPFHCGEKCFFRTVCESLLQHHRRSQCGNQEKNHSCDRCGVKFMWADNLRRHRELVHTDDPTTKDQGVSVPDLKHDRPTDAEQSLLLFDCDMCEGKYSNQDSLNTHIRKMHQRPQKTKTEASTTKASGKPLDKKFLCSLCGCTLSTSSCLLDHMRRHSGEKPHKCDLCDKRFITSSDMLLHRRTHSGERPHRCHICQKDFGRSYKMHMLTHSGERPYKCSYCEKSFTQSFDLTLHTRRHTGERPFGCDVCGKRFVRSTDLKRHRQLLGHLMKETNVALEEAEDTGPMMPDAMPR